MSIRIRIAGLLFFSGFCALVYQTVWLRELRLIMGASTPATATVLAIFMAGLGIGGLILSKRADRSKNPLAFYANLEAGIAIISGITPFILQVGRGIYLGLGGTLVFGAFWGTIIRILISAVVLIIPTFLMGGTLPAAAKAARSSSDSSNRNLALIYGTNTLGAVAGAVLSTFYLLEFFGNRQTLWIACLINLIVFISARAQSRKMVVSGAEDGLSASDLEGIEGRISSKIDSFAPGWITLFAATLSGFAFFLMELVWYRMLAPILGGSTYTFGTILSVALLGIGCGGILYSLKPDRLPSLKSFAWTCSLEALFLLVPYALGDRIAILSLMFRNLGFYGFWGYAVGWTLICFIVVFPAAVIAGYQFPLLISLLNPKDERFAWKIGLTYGFNTAGSIAGSLLGGFGLLPLLTAPGAWKMTSGIMLGMSALAMILSIRKNKFLFSASNILFLIVVAMSAGFIFSEGPTAAWRHSGIGAGRSMLITGATNFGEIQTWRDQQNEKVLNSWDGVESSVALVKGQGLAFMVNGKTDGNTIGDAGTQIMAGLLAGIFHDSPKTSFVVGLGTGSTAGWLAAIPSMERVDVAEIEPVIIHVAEASGPVNCSAMKNPKVHVLIGDGREIIMSSPAKYDIIASEPSNPYRAGISSLFTLDFYRSVASKLNPGGIFVHWVQAYEIDAGSIWTIYSTLSEVFPYIETWHTNRFDIALVASMQPFNFNVERLREKITSEPYAEALKDAWDCDTLEDFIAHREAGSGLPQKIHSVKEKFLNTDDHNHLEFDFARTVGRKRNFNEGQIYIEARKLPDFYGPFSGQKVNWAEVERRRLKWIAFGQRDTTLVNVSEQKIKANLDIAVSNGYWNLAKKIIRSNKSRLPFNTSRSMLPITLIQTNDIDAEKAIEKHSVYRPQETAALRAIYAVKKERWDSALESSLEFIHVLREIPWASDIVVSTFFSELPVIARNTNGGAQKLIDALLEAPFAVYAYDFERYKAAISIAEIGGAEYCKKISSRKFYYTAGKIEYLDFLLRCTEENSSNYELIRKVINRLKENESPAFGQIMDSFNNGPGAE